MAEYDFETIKTLLLKSIDNGWEAELTLYMNEIANPPAMLGRIE